ncbi:MAG TPA: hypothetical protein VF035_09820 [Longimicrobiales bacterium]
MVLCLLLDRLDDAAVAAVTGCVPRLAVEAGARLWVDARGLDLRTLYATVSRAVRETGVGLRAGAAAVPVAAQLAATLSGPGQLEIVAAGEDRAYVGTFALSSLDLDAHVLSLLAGVGVETCRQLAELPREAIEVRFGPEALQAWRLARADDERRLFRPHPPEEPHASIDFIDYSVTDPERLLFTGNALLGTICDALLERGSHARRMLLTLPLADGTRWQRELKPARATADRAVWLRLLRSLLERLTVSDAVAGMHLEVGASQAAAASQGDLFDSGFATAAAVEDVIGRLQEQHEDVVVRPVRSAHPLAETRVTYEPAKLASLVTPAVGHETTVEGLTLQLLEHPRPILVETARRRDHAAPVRYCDGEWRGLLHAAGPDRLSGGQWDQSYAREYYRAVTTEGTLIWIFRDACRDRWYLHGWWD